MNPVPPSTVNFEKTFRYILAAWSLLAAAQISIQAGPPPVIQSVLPAPGTVGALTNITITFSEPVTGISFEDLLINGGASANGLSGAGATYTFTLEAQPLYGPVTISWDMNHLIYDLDLPANRFDEAAPSASWQYTLVDGTPPTIAMLTPLAGVTVRQLSQIDVQFSELVAGVDAADLLINGTPAAGLSVLAGGSYRFTFPQPTNGPVLVTWATNHNLRDFATVPNAFAGGVLASYTLDPSAGLANLRINEFLTSAINTNGLKDENNELQDWIEIYNAGTSAVNLAGYALTDDQDDPGKWTFPATNLAPGRYLVVFASEKNRKSPGAGQRFHTNFRLNPFGDYLALFNADAPRVALSEFAPEYPEQRNDYSYGVDGSGVALAYFSAPTPGATNGPSAIAGVAPAPHVNVSRGFFDAPFTLLLNAPLAGATIRYTRDGSEPSGTNGLVYTGALTITNTTIFRAATFKTNLLPSVAVTHSYIFLDAVIRQPEFPAGFPPNWGPDVGALFAAVTNISPADYAMDQEIATNAAYSAKMKPALQSLPSLSIVMNVEDLFGTNRGIYTHSSDSQTLYRGPAWERACSAEFILTNGETAFQVNAGLQIQGNASRNPVKQPKHPLRLLFKGEFGPTDLDYQVIPDSPVTGFDSLVLRSDFNSAWTHWDAGQRSRGSRIRDAWAKDTFRAMGGLAAHSRHFHLYLNGLYWGLYEFSEKADADFAAGYLGGEKEDYDAIASKPTQAIDGDLLAYNAMVALRNLQDTNQYKAMLSYLDMTTFVDYMLLEFYGANADWGRDGNWNAVRRRSPEGRFQYVLWDAERLIENNADNRVTSTDLPSNLHTNLLLSAEYKLTFADRAHKHLFNGGALTTNEVVARWLARANSIDPAIVAESARWGDYRRDGAAIGTQVGANGPYWLYSRDTNWVPEINRIATNYFPARHSIFLGQLTTAGLYPLVTPPHFNQHGGSVARGFLLTMTASNTIYFTLDGSDPRVFGTGGVAPGALTYAGAVTLTNTVTVKSRARFGTNWSAMNEATFNVDSLAAPLRITEIMYNSPGDAYEFVELRNVSAAAISVGYWSVDGLGQNDTGYIFPPNTTLAPGQIIVLGSDSSLISWTNRYPGVTAFGFFSGKLDNGGEKLGVRDGNGRLLWSVDYDDENGWPLAADGFGASLEIIDVFGDQDNPANWRASAATNGTPGVISAPPSTGSVVLNEVMANNVSSVENNGFFPDWVELYNGSASPVNLAGWSLTDDSNPRKFVLPATTLPAGEYLVIWCDSTNTALGGLRAPFSLGANGEQVLLYDAASNRVDSIGFGVQPANYTIGRVGGAWTLTQPTTNATNIAVTLASTTNLVINEWLANAVPGGDDWVELYNRHLTAPVALQGIYVGVSNALHQFNALSFLAPGGYVQLLADGNPGANHLDFNLSAAGETIVLYDATGVERDRVTYGPQAQGVSQGRLPDGAANSVTFSFSQSPEASNYLLNYSGPFLNEVLAVNRSAVTNTAGRTADYVELRNTNIAGFDLSGYRLSTDPDDASQWAFPAGSSIPGLGYLVVWFDAELPPTTLAGAYQNTGRSLSGDGEQVWLFNTTGVPVDAVAFGFQVENLPLGRSGSNWVLLASASPGSVNGPAATLGQPTALRVNEWMASPISGSDWFELFNTGNAPVALEGVIVADNPMSFTPDAPGQTALAPLSYIGAKGFVKIIADGDRQQGPNHVGFNLDGEGEALRVFSPAMAVIDTVYFGAQEAGVSQGRLTDGQAPVVSFPASATPGASNYLPPPYAVINEVLTHTDAPLEDAVEIHNPSAQGAQLGGWFLSNSADDLKKFRIPDGTALPAGGFIVLYQTQFNNGGAGSFTLNSAHGDQLYLSEADGSGNLTGYRAQVAFGAAENGVSFGRLTTCNGLRFVALESRTFGQDNPASLVQFRTGSGLPNSTAKVGPVTINEIYYHPPDIGGTTDDTLNEFIELRNITGASVNLFDAAHSTNTWRLAGGVSFAFPTNVTLAAGAHLLVVSFNPGSSPAQLAAFRAINGVSVSTAVYGPWSGKLDNGGETLELYRPDAPQMPPHPDAGFVPQILVDRVSYGDTAPWPVGGDGDGQSLQKISANAFGDDAANWAASAPTAGGTNAAQPAVAPSIVEHPFSRMAATNSRVVFSVTACGSQPFSYQWLKNGGTITDATNAAYLIASAQPADAATYTVLVSNGAGPAVGGPAVLTLGMAPAITSQPASTNVALSAPFSLSVAAGGTGPLNYQWRLNGLPIPGATGTVYTVASAQSSDAGTYSVVVANGVGVALSGAAQVGVVSPLIITTQPFDQAANTNATVNFIAAGTGTGTVRYQWLFNGNAIAGATNGTLVLSNANLGQEGVYQCQLTDDLLTALSNPARLVVRVPPTILVRPMGVTNATGSTLSFFIQCSGSVPMGFEWRQGATPRTNIVLNTTNCTFTIPFALPATSGTWRVVITNSGSPTALTNTTFAVVVLNPPAITNQPVSRTVDVGTNVSFSVVAGPTNLLAYQWYFMNAPLAAATNASLNLSNVQAANAGGYFVIVTNVAGSATSQVATLALNGPPSLSEPEYLSNGWMRFKISGVPNRSYFVDISSNLPNWNLLTNLVYTNGLMPFIDTTAPGVTNRFYRLRE
jgi:Lamin Tail Domain/CotH kinase protein/Fn3 associated